MKIIGALHDLGSFLHLSDTCRSNARSTVSPDVELLKARRPSETASVRFGRVSRIRGGGILSICNFWRGLELLSGCIEIVIRRWRLVCIT
jgi:hypothetical protein